MVQGSRRLKFTSGMGNGFLVPEETGGASVGE